MTKNPNNKFNMSHGKQKTKINTKSRQKAMKSNMKKPNKTLKLKKSADTSFNEVKV